ncbi:hypothetical protein EPR50_G00025940 [Perca flavescens]|uniref:Immunoglobulin domain-containing protein n=1 Tax=Perca flavescens TaxID=8167 RepID=A0A484DKD6_PERFV|nr:uncharacterized protein LOC114552729 [Perca flavescens]TDH14927.1 hypothetical protein EPR50_G00025940 [Perca flavescens]
MMIAVHFTLLFFWVTQDFVSCINMKTPFDSVAVALGDSLTLNCTYNCSNGFVRGCWSKASDISGCHGTVIKGSLCTTSFHLSNVSSEDLKGNYTCYTQDTGDPQLQQKTERIVLLQPKAQTSAPNWTITPKSITKNASLPAKPKDSSGGEFTGIKVLATVTVAVATVLAALAVYLCLNRSRQSWNDKGEPVVSRSGSPLPHHAVPSPVKGSMSTQSERVILRIPTPDNESDTEVPYADIMITVRGVSTPELTQVGYLTPGDQKEWWGDESRSHLQASRSADRLHVPQPREVSRKMSTNSEYAVITYA